MSEGFPSGLGDSVCRGEFSELLSSAGDTGFDGGFGEAHETTDFAVAHVLKGFEEEGFSVAVGEEGGEVHEAGGGVAAFVGFVGGEVVWGGALVGVVGGVGGLAAGGPGADLTGASGGVGGVEGDGTEPGLEGAGVAEFVDFADKGEGDFLEEVFDIGPTGFVGEKDGGDPAAVIVPEGADGGFVTGDGLGGAQLEGLVLEGRVVEGIGGVARVGPCLGQG